MKIATELLSKQELKELAIDLNVSVDKITQSPFDNEILLVNNSIGYRVIERNDIKDKILEWFESQGSPEYFLAEILGKREANQVVDELGVDLIVSVDKFVEDSNRKILEDWNEEKEELIKLNKEEWEDLKQGEYKEYTFSDFISDEYDLLESDLNNPKKLWEKELVFIPAEYDFEYSDNIIKQYGINDEVVYKYIYKHFANDKSILSDYSEKHIINDKLIYKKDAEYIKEKDLELEKKVTKKLSQVIEEAIEKPEYWNGSDEMICETSPFGYDIKIEMINEEDTKDGIRVTAYGLKEDTAEDRTEGVYLIDTDNELVVFTLTEKEIKKMINNSKTQSNNLKK